MTIYQHMAEAFRVADVPGFLQAWRKTEQYPTLPDLYAVYNLQTERPLICADDAAIITRYDVRVWVYGVEDVSEAVAALCDALQLEGFTLPRAQDAYATVNGEHRYIKQIETTFIDYGEYGPQE